MVEHSLSMSLNHHVPIFKCTLTGVRVRVCSRAPPPSYVVTCFWSRDLALWPTGTFVNGGSSVVCLRTLQILRV